MARLDILVIVGAGLAAAELSFALRREGYTGQIVMVGEEAYLPYQRPPLSKAYLAGKVPEHSLYLKSNAAYEKADIEYLLETRVERVEPPSKRVALSSGEYLTYGTLVLALGGRPKYLDIPGADRALRNLHAIRTLDDVNRARPHFVPGKRLVIVGGGYIGLEIAAVARNLGLDVCVLEALPRVLARVAAPQISEFYERVHRSAGVDLRTRAHICRFELNAEGDWISAVHCDDGEIIDSDLVIVGIGMVPNTELARSAGLEVQDGIVVDEDCRTSDSNIFAIGDCACYPHLGPRGLVRLESVPNAREQARNTAAVICGKPRTCANVPWFWSDQYDLKLQIAGLSRDHDNTVVRGSSEARRFAVVYLKRNRIIAVDAVNSPEDFMAARLLIARNLEVEPTRVADESAPLQSAARAQMMRGLPEAFLQRGMP